MHLLNSLNVRSEVVLDFDYSIAQAGVDPDFLLSFG